MDDGQKDTWAGVLLVLRLMGTGCLFRKSGASIPLGTPSSSPAPEAMLERGAPRKNPGELVAYL